MKAEGVAFDEVKVEGLLFTKSKPRSCAARSWLANPVSTVATPVPFAPSKSAPGVLPRVHGSALFTRGETQALVISTLGTEQDAQRIDALAGEFRDTFLFHYNMPPFATGETGRGVRPSAAKSATVVWPSVLCAAAARQGRLCLYRACGL